MTGQSRVCIASALLCSLLCITTPPASSSTITLRRSPAPAPLSAMAKPSALLLLPVCLLAGILLPAEATYYRHHRYIPHIYRYREHSANAENLLPEVSQPDAPTYPVVPEVLHPAPEVIHPVPDALHPMPEVVHPAPDALPEVYQHVPAASSPAANRVFYGIMFDAGSTGSRIHIYKFIQKDPGECGGRTPLPERARGHPPRGEGEHALTRSFPTRLPFSF